MSQLSGASPINPGTIVAHGGAPPSGWLLCDGSAVNRTTYGGLFAAIGTTFGAGDGATTFNVPDMRGRTAAGKDDMGGTAANRLTVSGSGINGATLGAVGGTETHTLSTAQLPAHAHSITDPTHSHGQHASDGSGGNPSFTRTNTDAAGVGAGNTFSAGTGITTTNNQGSGSAHQNTQPTIVANYIIKA